MSDTANLFVPVVAIPATAQTLDKTYILTHAEATPGWYHPLALEYLYMIASNCGAYKRGFLEVGTWLGRSATVLAGVAKALGTRLTCVDTWTGLVGQPNDPRYQETNVLERAKENLSEYLDCITFLQGDSREVLKQFPHHSFGLVHIDGDHSSPVVNFDVAMGWNLVSSNGVLCGDDFNEPDVAQAVFAGIPTLSVVNIFANRVWSVWKDV